MTVGWREGGVCRTGSRTFKRKGLTRYITEPIKGPATRQQWTLQMIGKTIRVFEVGDEQNYLL